MDILLGLQWGDEGKGKVVDFLAPKYDLIARFQGGPNAGHTLHFEGQKHVLHQIPSGAFREGCQNIIGNGVVLDLVTLRREITEIEASGADLRPRLFVSRKAQLILPTHRLLDAAYENAKGDQKIGSTLRGIGPTYQDKIGRLGLRIGDLFSPNFQARYEALRERHLTILRQHNHPLDELESLEKNFFEAVAFTKELQCVDSEYFVNERFAKGESILAEGAQGTLLDIDFGSYPFVTSSNTTSAGACTGLGVAPRSIGQVFGIFKAYCTRVGSGPFPTEQHEEDGEALRQAGNEFGATTGRPRRCGWLDLPALRYAIMLNGVTQLFMMKVDVLSGFDEIKVCTQYRLPDGTLTDHVPFDAATPIEPVYETLPGWGELPEKLESLEDFPEALRQYKSFLEERLKTPIALLSYGPGRDQTFLQTRVLSL